MYQTDPCPPKWWQDGCEVDLSDNAPVTYRDNQLDTDELEKLRSTLDDLRKQVQTQTHDDMRDSASQRIG